ncbi:MAG: extracellular solute-binding protein [Immundisolibacterales bacterium]|nr:extracellular solute-binding protein [Immundisolibacterales bacterium]
MPQSRPTRRTVLKGAAAAAAASTVGFPAIVGFAKEFDGVTINGASFQHVFFNYLKEYIPEFEEQSGMKVNFNTQAFPVYNQRTDLELSTKGSALDVVNVTFIYTGRWIGAGWVENLDPFVNDPNMTPSDWDASDFVGGAQSSLQDKAGSTYGFAWEAGAMIMGMSRGDLLDQAGVGVPESFDDLINVCDKIHNQERVTAFVADKLHHWNWIPYLMGHGGRIFKDPPGNLTPVLDTPEAAKAAEYYANLLTSYGPSGVLSYTDDQAMRAQIAGRSNIRTQAIGWMTPLVKHEDSKVKDTARYGLMPGGPAGNFPGSNSHGLGIPVGSKNKRAAWEFIKWAMSKETTRRIALEKGYSAVCRRSVISDPAYRENMTLNGQDVASIYLKVLELGGKSGYMKYRTVPIFPQVGDKLNKAIERVATRQQNGAEAMAQAQEEAIADLRKAGVEMDV